MLHQNKDKNVLLIGHFSSNNPVTQKYAIKPNEAHNPMYRYCPIYCFL